MHIYIYTYTHILFIYESISVRNVPIRYKRSLSPLQGLLVHHNKSVCGAAGESSSRHSRRCPRGAEGAAGGTGHTHPSLGQPGFSTPSAKQAAAIGARTPRGKPPRGPGSPQPKPIAEPSTPPPTVARITLRRTVRRPKKRLLGELNVSVDSSLRKFLVNETLHHGPQEIQGYGHAVP